MAASLSAGQSNVEAGQELTVEMALALARANNGVVRAAFLNYQAARSNALIAGSAYWPTVIPSFQYDTNRLNAYTGPSVGAFDSVTSAAMLTANWQIVDSGERSANYSRATASRDSSEFNALRTLRTTLFDVHRSFYDALRADELLQVRNAQLERAEGILKQTEAFVEAGASARKDTLQAKADALNAKATELAARNRVTTSRAELKAIVGIPRDQQLPSLQSTDPSEVERFATGLVDEIEFGLANRADLMSRRKDVAAARSSVRLARVLTGVTWSLDARHVRAFSPDPFDQSFLILQASFPLFDGQRSREALRASKLGMEATEELLTQAERNVVAEIESSYKEFDQNIDRLGASKLALEAALINYQAVFESRKAGASELIELLTAQVSLTTAESNYIEAYYDTLISQVQLRLATGRGMPGEESQ
ncbi:MAG: TolC family protein [Armatimonadetes bacterium]|nr:TolC family protein [Armatimonadota bacterium]